MSVSVNWSEESQMPPTWDSVMRLSRTSESEEEEEGTEWIMMICLQ